MYELVEAGENTFYIDCPSKVGIFRLGGPAVCLIDSGSDKDAAKKVLKALETKGWKAELIINTHSHADHIGGNAYLQRQTGAPVLCAGIDALIAREPILEPIYLYGGYPFKALQNKFLMAQPGDVRELTAEALPEGLEMLRLDGHAPAMSVLKTGDGVWFIADSLTPAGIIEKYHVSYIYDVGGYLSSLSKLEALEGRLFIPSHGEPLEDLAPLIELNLRKVYEIISLVKEICAVPTGFEDILKAVFDRYGLVMDLNQSVLVGGTLRSYLSFLCDCGEIEYVFVGNRMLWKSLERA